MSRISADSVDFMSRISTESVDFYVANLYRIRWFLCVETFYRICWFCLFGVARTINRVFFFAILGQLLLLCRIYGHKRCVGFQSRPRFPWIASTMTGLTSLTARECWVNAAIAIASGIIPIQQKEAERPLNFSYNEDPHNEVMISSNLTCDTVPLLERVLLPFGKCDRMCRHAWVWSLEEGSDSNLPNYRPTSVILNKPSGISQPTNTPISGPGLWRWWRRKCRPWNACSWWCQLPDGSLWREPPRCWVSRVYPQANQCSTLVAGVKGGFIV